MGEIIGSIAGAFIGASASKKASRAQAGAAEDQLDLQRDIFETTAANQAPFIEGGTLALEALLFELGLGDAPEFGGSTAFNVGERTFDTRDAADEFLRFERDRFTEANRPRPQIEINEREGGFRILQETTRQGDIVLPSGFNPFDLGVDEVTTPGTTFQGFQESPGFKFGFQQGVNAVDASAAAGGSLFSGATGEALTEFGQGFAGLARGTFLDRLRSLVSSGQGAVGQLAQSAASFGTGASSALAGLGNAQAAGAIGFGNAISSGLNSLATSIGSSGFNFFGGGSSSGKAQDFTGALSF